MASRQKPPPAEDEPDAQEPEDRVVREPPVEAFLPREADLVQRDQEDDCDQGDPGDRERIDPLVMLAEAPRSPLVPAVALAPAQVDRDHKGDVEADDGNRRADRVPNEVVPDGRDHQDACEEPDTEYRPLR